MRALTDVERQAVREMLETPGWTIVRDLLKDQYDRTVTRLLTQQTVGEARAKDLVVEARTWKRAAELLECAPTQEAS